MKILTIALSISLLAPALIQSEAQAARLIGANPDLLLTISERQQAEKLFREGKTKSLHGDHANRAEAKELDRWFKRKDKRRSVSSTNR